MLAKELVQAAALIVIEPISPAAQQAQPGAVPAQLWTDLAGHPHQVHADHADRVEAVRNDPRLGEPSPYERPRGVRQVDADRLDGISAPQFCQEPCASSGSLRPGLMSKTRWFLADSIRFCGVGLDDTADLL